MSAKCASCRYPLTVSDSVVCHECWSYFHIDCAQLVGFPWFVLSGEPGKNIFHCTTCQLLPLPVERDDSSDDEGMPSRQLDVTLEGEADLAKDMNEVKGGIQDLSDLCKDILREINDLKSINLTLRCCVENLRHDNEQRDTVISELKLRLDLLEGKYSGRNTTDSTISLDESRRVEREEVDTPYELECTRINASSNLAKNIKYDRKIDQHLENTSSLPKESSPVNESEDEAIWAKQNEDLTDFYLNENNQNEDTETGYVDYKRNDEKENYSKQDIFTAREELKAEIVNEKNQSKQDWSWRGNQAVEVQKEDNTNEEEEEESEDETEAEDKEDSQSWQKLEEEFESLVKQEGEVAESLSEDEFWELQQDEKSEQKQEFGRARKSVRWEEGIADDDSESEADWSQKEIKETEIEEQTNEEQKNEKPSEVDEETRVHEDLPAKGDLEGRLEAGEELLVEPTESAETECHLESSKFALEGEEDNLEIRDGTSDVQTTLEYGEGLPDIEAHLEDETEAVSYGEEGVHLEGEAENNEGFRLEEEVAENEESRLDMPEFSEEQIEPPESPPSIHTEEDLWLYLKDNVSAVHPSTVEEFVQNLIGTLQHVPEEYLKPVIEANIRRVKTPSVTDGEHLTTPVDEEGNNEEPLEGDNLNSVAPQHTQGIFTSATEEVLSQFPGGSSALEGALFVGFWACWLYYTLVWDT